MGKTDAHGMKYILENGKRVPGVTTIIGSNLGMLIPDKPLQGKLYAPIDESAFD